MGSLPFVNRTSKATRALLVAALATALSACSGGSEPSGAPATATATVTVTASVTPSPVASTTLSPSPAQTPAASESADPGTPATASPSVSVSGSRDVDATVRGKIALRGVDGITVTSESDREVKALLLPFTVVYDARGLVCREGKAPSSCSMEELKAAIKQRGVLFAKVTIKDGVAIQVEDITEG